MENTPLAYCISDRMGQLILFSMKEVIGERGFSAVMNLAGFSPAPEEAADDGGMAIPSEKIGSLQRALEQAYGSRGGQGLALRSGRLFFTHLVREYGASMGLSEASFRLQPPERKVIAGLRILANFFNQNMDQSVQVTDTDKHIFWRVERCPICWERHESEPVCHLIVGMLQEGLYWLSGGKVYNILEETPPAFGKPACLIRIDKNPIA